MQNIPETQSERLCCSGQPQGRKKTDTVSPPSPSYSHMSETDGSGSEHPYWVCLVGETPDGVAKGFCANVEESPLLAALYHNLAMESLGCPCVTTSTLAVAAESVQGGGTLAPRRRARASQGRTRKRPENPKDLPASTAASPSGNMRLWRLGIVVGPFPTTRECEAFHEAWSAGDHPTATYDDHCDRAKGLVGERRLHFYTRRPDVSVGDETTLLMQLGTHSGELAAAYQRSWERQTLLGRAAPLLEGRKK